MNQSRPKVLLVCNQDVRERYVTPPDLDRLAQFGDFEWLESTVTGGSWTETPDNPDATSQVVEHVGDVDALLVCHGSPRISTEILDAAPKLRIIGELEGDRFAARIDVE
ncbi:MAG TPA: hypothetical protein VMP10_03850, partial [Chloroflexota bacterium]|nr:hypothetical protein [Chloroflexota bacterium]